MSVQLTREVLWKGPPTGIGSSLLRSKGNTFASSILALSAVCCPALETRVGPVVPPNHQWKRYHRRGKLSRKQWGVTALGVRLPPLPLRVRIAQRTEHPSPKRLI